MLRSDPQGGIGNRLFQYAFSRLLAGDLGYDFSSPEVPGFPQLVTSIPGVMKIDGELICKGYFEHAPVYAIYHDEIQEWFQLGPGKRESRTVIHVRGGDAAREGFRCPPIEYYQEAIRQAQFSERWIVTDDPNNDICLSLARQFHIPVYCRDTMLDWESIRNAGQIIIGNSTFSWWAAFLSGHNNVIQPEPLKGWRSRDMPQKCLIVPEWKQITY